MTVTRADVAQRAGVSPALVSYVLNNGPRPVSAQARERIEAAINELGYRPNAIAQALRKAQTLTVGLLTPSAVNPFFGELITAIKEELFTHGYVLDIGVTGDDSVREQHHIQSFLDRKVDGIIVISSQASEVKESLERLNIPVVLLDRVPFETPGVSVLTDNTLGVQLAITHLREHGMQRIACIGGRIGTSSADQRVEAWHENLTDEELPHAPDLLIRVDFTEPDGYRAAMELLQQTPRPDALLISSDMQSFGALGAISDLGLRVPEDIAVVSFDGTEGARFTVPELTRVAQPIQELATQCFELLRSAIATPVLATECIVLAPQLVVGTSCGCAYEFSTRAKLSSRVA